ncbi:hypothetical protein J7E62_27375 [Variovorax paradoxus]|nr:hypothetical protein [Variovorax paradoxus]
MSGPFFRVGQKVTALVNMENDLTDDGMGVEQCARSGETLVVRRVSSGYLNCIAVSHEHITDRAFCVAPHEIQPQESPHE